MGSKSQVQNPPPPHVLRNKPQHGVSSLKKRLKYGLDPLKVRSCLLYVKKTHVTCVKELGLLSA